MTQETTTQNLILSRCGTALMFAGAMLTAAVFVDHWTDLKVPFPSFWYTSRSLHPLLCVGFFLGGWHCHRTASTGLLSIRNGPVFDEIIVYTQDRCERCDQALATLSDYARWLPPISEVNISVDEELRNRFSQSVPIVEMDGVVQFRERVNREILERLIHSRQIQKTTVIVRDHSNEESETRR